MFKFLSGNINYLTYSGSWYRKIKKDVYHVITVFNWKDSVGEKEAKEIGAIYNISLDEIDLSIIPKEGIDKALEYCGLDQMENINEIKESNKLKDQLILVESLKSYGQFAPLHSRNGNNFKKLFKECKNISNQISYDYGLHELYMEKPVNKIGTNARNYMLGNII